LEIGISEPSLSVPSLSWEEARQTAAPESQMAQLLDWLEAYPMSNHTQLGRTGTVCPFVKQSARLNILRVTVSQAGPADEDAVYAMIKDSFTEIEEMDAPEGKERLRTAVIGYPNCGGPEGIAMLDRVFHRFKYYTLLHFRMMAFFHADSQIGGLWNHDFKPMRAPMPLLGVRYLIEQDAVFAAKHKIMLPSYLLRFGLPGARRLGAYYRQAGKAEAVTGA
jgi:hypothetical protein